MPGRCPAALERLLKVRDSCLAAAILRRQGASNIERLRVIGLHLNGPRRLFDGLRAVAGRVGNRELKPGYRIFRVLRDEALQFWNALFLITIANERKSHFAACQFIIGSELQVLLSRFRGIRVESRVGADAGEQGESVLALRGDAPHPG